MDGFWSGLIGNIIGAALGSALSIWGAIVIFRRERRHERQRDLRTRYQMLIDVRDGLAALSIADTEPTKHAAIEGTRSAIQALNNGMPETRYPPAVVSAATDMIARWGTVWKQLHLNAPVLHEAPVDNPPLLAAVNEMELALDRALKAAGIESR